MEAAAKAHRAANQERDVIAVVLQEQGMTHLQIMVLLAVQESGPIDQLTMARLVGRTPQVSGRVLVRLDAMNLITRLPHPGDRRVKLVHLTDTARSMLDGAANYASPRSSNPALNDADLREALHTIITNPCFSRPTSP